MREPWYIRHPMAAVLSAFVGALLLGGTIWGVRVALAPVKGAGDVVIEQNKATTIIGSQEELQERYQGIQSLCAQIPIFREQLAADPKNFVAKTNLTAARTSYVEMVAQYNAMTQKLTAKNQLGDLPQRIEAQEC